MVWKYYGKKSTSKKKAAPKKKSTKKAAPKKKTYAKKAYKKKTKYGKAKSMIHNKVWGNGNPMPPLLYTTFSFTDYLRLQASSGLCGNASVRLNSLYDPDYGVWSINGQPMYYDQLCNADMYNDYTVTGVKITLYINNNVDVPCAVLIRWSKDATFITPTTNTMLNQLAGEPQCAFFSQIDGISSGTGKRTFRKYFSMAKLNQVKRVDLLDAANGFTSAYTTNPAIENLLRIDVAGPATYTATAADVGLQIKFKWYVRLSNLKEEVPASLTGLVPERMKDRHQLKQELENKVDDKIDELAQLEKKIDELKLKKNDSTRSLTKGT